MGHFAKIRFTVHRAARLRRGHHSENELHRRDGNYQVYNTASWITRGRDTNLHGYFVRRRADSGHQGARRWPIRYLEGSVRQTLVAQRHGFQAGVPVHFGGTLIFDHLIIQKQMS